MGVLEGKIAIVTGAAAGIGESIARLFAGEGAPVFALDIDGAGAHACAASIREAGGAAFACEADVRCPEMIAAAVERAMAEYGRIDVLVNNAGAYPRCSFLDMTAAHWNEILDVNLNGTFHATKAVVPHMVARRSGKIVNISSVVFHLGVKNLTHYIAAKGGIIGFTRALAREMGEHNIHVNCITPGAIRTASEARVATEEQANAIMEMQCLRRRLLPLDVARVCAFLASEWSDGMTGQTLNVDGGWAMY